MALTQEKLRWQIEYDPETGVFTNRIDRKGSRGRIAKAGDKPGSINNGYLQITVDGRTYRAHRLAWLYVYGHFPDAQVDHRDGNRLNNKISNLRACTPGENNENQAKRKGDFTSKQIGVCYCNHRGRWVAYVRRDGKSKYRYFRTEQEAVAARAKLKAELHSFNPVDREAA